MVPHNAQIRNVTGKLIIVQNDDNSIDITGKINGLTEGLHGFHVHEKGDLRNGCTSTGPHFNPENVNYTYKAIIYNIQSILDTLNQIIN